MSDKADQVHNGGAALDMRDGPNLLPPRAALAELIVLLGLIVGTSWLFPAVDVTQLQPNPFWLPVLVLSLQYGTVSGLLAATGAIAISLLGYPLPEQENGENLYTYAARTFAQPVLWIAAAVLIGQFRVRQIEAKRSLVRAVDVLTGERASLAAYAQGLRQRCDRLEREIVGRSTPPTLAALAALDGLLAAEPAGMTAATALEKGLDAVFPGATGVVIARSAGRVTVIASHPAAFVQRGDKAFDTLAALVIDQGREFDVLSREGEAALAGVGMAAVAIPARDAATGSIRIAALVIDALPADAVSDAILPSARMLARAMAPAVAAAMAQLPQSDAASPSVAPALQVVVPLAKTAGRRPRTIVDTAKASRRWAKFGWLPGNAGDAAVSSQGVEAPGGGTVGVDQFAAKPASAKP